MREWFPHPPPPAILMYHRIAEESFDPWGGAITPAHFRDHLSWLSQNRTVLPLIEFAELHRRGALPADAVALTIDDGYACNSEVAAPLLEEFQIPATLFLPIGVLMSGRPFWWDELEDIVLEHEGPELTLDGGPVTLGEKSATDRQWAPWSPPGTPRQAAYHDMHVQLARTTPGRLVSVMEDLRHQAKPVTEPAGLKRPMTREEVRRARNRFVEFGSHALNHPWLPDLDPAEQQHEICDSMEQCRELTGERPVAFAYPFGMFDEHSQQLAKEAGFACACTTRDRAVLRKSPMFALPRLPIDNCDAAALEQSLAQARLS
ncbi:MAG TPA: polysaccharide deacetylase family protein [Sphingomicrobium sp.]|nr:polysaccharide deacetylase family protein [Sphingomicrobium sp.]